jgi:hypothetical protein
LVCWVNASVDFDEVVDGGGFGASAPVADVVVLEELCPGCAVCRVVEVFAPVVSHDGALGRQALLLGDVIRVPLAGQSRARIAGAR